MHRLVKYLSAAKSDEPRFMLLVLVALAAATLALRPAKAEMLVLASGGRLEGQLLNPEENPRVNYQFRLAGGAEVCLSADVVSQYKADRPEVVEYGRIRDKFPDTVDGQYKLALWCREHNMSTQEYSHLRRVIELDPDHKDARQKLGYSKFDGQWMTLEEKKIKDGYVRDRRGDWKLPQEIELEERRDRQQAAEKEWFRKVALWRGWLNGERRKLGRDNLVNITDPNAVRPIAMRLVGSNIDQKENVDPEVEARLIYVEALAHISAAAGDLAKAGRARAALAMAALADDEEEVRLSCLDELAKQKDDAITVAFFIKQLRNKQNFMVNRAAVGLAKMKDPTAIGPLIDALITAHKEVVGGGGNPGQTTTSFGTRGTPGGGMSVGQKPTVIVHHIQNQAVLDALVALTQKNFGFSVNDWHAWFVAQQSKGSGGVDVRRDK